MSLTVGGVVSGEAVTVGGIVLVTVVQLTLPETLPVRGIELNVIRSLSPQFSSVPCGFAMLNFTAEGGLQKEGD